MNEDARERYGQRYETWRHLDGLRYQTIQMTIGIFGVVAAILQIKSTFPSSLLLFVMGGIMLSQWKLLAKINDGIVLNGIALEEFAREVGDRHVPNVSQRNKSIFYWVEVFFLLLGITLMLAGSVIFFMEQAN